MLRTGLMVFNPEQRLGSVLITSAGEKDGKTTVAVRLALVAARAGLRVLLIDADLRRAQVGARLGIQAEAGLGAVLAGERPLDEVLVDLLVDGPASGQLTVLPAGPPPSNPAALIGSNEMRRVLAEAESRWDLVIVDTPAALAVSDPLPLMRVVSGVVLVARMNRSRPGRCRRMQVGDPGGRRHLARSRRDRRDVEARLLLLREVLHDPRERQRRQGTSRQGAAAGRRALRAPRRRARLKSDQRSLRC